MTGDRFDDEPIEQDDLLDDDEFVLELGDEANAELANDPTTTAATAESLDAADPFALSEPAEPHAAFESGATSFGELDDGDFDCDLDTEIEFIEEPAAEGVEDPFLVVDSASADEDGNATVSPDDLLFEDSRDDVSQVSEFGAELRGSFEPEADFDLPQEAVAADDIAEVSDAGDLSGDAFEIEVHELEDDGNDWPTFDENVQPESIAPQAAGALGVRDVAPSEEDEAFAAEEWSDEPAAEGLDAEGGGEFDPIYGDAVDAEAAEGSYQEGEEYAPAAAASYEDAEADYSEYEEAYADGTVTGPSGEWVGGVEGRSRWSMRAAAGIAAALLVSAAGATWFLKPEWFGGAPATVQPTVETVLVDRTPVTRPQVELAVALPEVTFVAPPSTDPVRDPEGQGGNDPATTDPVVAIENPDPVTPDPLDPVVDPTEPDDPAVAVISDPVTTDVEEDLGHAGFVQAGDNILIAKVTRSQNAGAPAIARDLTPGRQAFAQLANGAYFTGRVRRVDPAHITLALTTGEVSFRYDELKELTPLENADLSMVTASQRGFVRLRNQARLFGQILRDPENERVTLMQQGSVVDVPDWQIERVGYEARGGVEVLDDDDDDWLRKRVRRRMQTQGIDDAR